MLDLDLEAYSDYCHYLNFKGDDKAVERFHSIPFLDQVLIATRWSINRDFAKDRKEGDLWQ